MRSRSISMVAVATFGIIMLNTGCAQEAPRTALGEGNIQLDTPPSPEVNAFVATARVAFAKTSAGRICSREMLSRPDALGGDWKLYSSETYGQPGGGIHELLYVAQKPLLDLVKKDEIVLNIKVFPSAATAREWALARALAGAAPTEWKINRAKEYFDKSGLPGEFCFGPELFVRGNVVVGYGSDIVPIVSERVDSVLQKLMHQQKLANQAPEDTARKLADPQR
jgi:hypothetical protein